MARIQASSKRYVGRSPQFLLERALDLQKRFLPQSETGGLDDEVTVVMTEEEREFLYQLLDILGREGKAAYERIDRIQRSLVGMNHTTQAHKEVLAWTVEQWWVEPDKAERGRLVTRLHDGVKAPAPKERKQESPEAAISIAGRTAARPGNLPELD